MDDVLRCVDLFGRRVRLPRQRWDDHILLDHAEMVALVHLIERALTEPDVVNRDAAYPDRENFYLLSVAGTQATRHVKVCVEYRHDSVTGSVTGSIVTAFVTRNVKSNEVPIWHRDS